MTSWERRRYRGNKVWIRVDDAGSPVLDDRALAALRYKPDDERTYSVRLSEVEALDAPEPRVSDPAPPADTAPRPADLDLIEIYTDGASSGNPGPGGLGAVLLWRGRRRELRRYLGETTDDVAELTAVLDALRAVKRPACPVRLHTGSSYVIDVLTAGPRATANQALIATVLEEMARFPNLSFVKVAAHAGVVENERADALARIAIREQA